jgi:hypothetical protein
LLLSSVLCRADGILIISLEADRKIMTVILRIVDQKRLTFTHRVPTPSLSLRKGRQIEII